MNSRHRLGLPIAYSGDQHVVRGIATKKHRSMIKHQASDRSGESRSAGPLLPRRRGSELRDGPAAAALIVRVVAREAAALSDLYELTAGYVFSLAGMILRNDADAEEIVSDVYVLVWQTAHRYDCARGSVLAWILSMCRSRSIDRYRSLRCRGFQLGEIEVLDGLVSDTEPDALWSNRQSAVMREAFRSLPPLRRTLLFLAFFRGLSHEEIAQETGISLGTVKSHIRRALLTLRALLERPGWPVPFKTEQSRGQREAGWRLRTPVTQPNTSAPPSISNRHSE